MKKLQLETTKIESDFYKEVQELEGKYQALYQPLFDKRTQIVKGRNLTMSGMYILHGTPCQKGGGVLKIFGDAKIILLCCIPPLLSINVTSLPERDYRAVFWPGTFCRNKNIQMHGFSHGNTKNTQD